MKRGALSMQGVRLLALSACSTAVGESGDGREFESFGTLAHRLGAEEVMASLWGVADLSTSVLMARFYGNRERAGRDDALALAWAQRSFLESTPQRRGDTPSTGLRFLVLRSG